MTINDDHYDLLVAVALGIAEPHEVAEVEHLITENPGYGSELAELRAASTTMATSVHQMEAPRGLKGSIMAAIGDEPVARSAPTRQKTRLSWPSWRQAGAWPALAGALAAVAIGMAAWNVGSAGDTPDRGRALAVQTAASLQGVDGDARILSDGGTAVVRLTGLPEIEPGRGYALWVIRDRAQPVSAGFLTTGPSGDLIATADQLAGATALAITPERLDNTTAPTSTPIITVGLG